MIEFTVSGPPVPQGSLWAAHNGGMHYSNAGTLGPWRNAVSGAAQEAMWGKPLMHTAVHVRLEFTMLKPKSVRRVLPTVFPDIDKLTRAALDAMTGVVYRDDGQVTTLIALKRYGDHPGLRCVITDDAA